MLPKIYTNKNIKGEFYFFSPIPLFLFEEKWNPNKEKEIKKEHLKLFLEEVATYNFRISGPYPAGGFAGNPNFFSTHSYFLDLFSSALFFYLHKKGFLHRKYFQGDIKIVINSSFVYKRFEHLITPENFSILLGEYLIEDVIYEFGRAQSPEDSSLDLVFISSGKEKEVLERELIFFEIEDKDLFFQFLEEKEKESIEEERNDILKNKDLLDGRELKKYPAYFADFEKYLK